ncbi:kinase-like domain-containing protein [Abortiporus biennis]|nr:kinase-like domain-containing protein [Abortiporus biennis]
MLDSFMHGKNVQHVVDLIQKILHLNVASSSQLVRISTNPARVVLRRFLAQLVLQKSTAPTNLLLSGITPSAQHALGEGSFGKVFKGAYENRVIAYKVFKTDRYSQNIDMNGPDIFSKVDMNHPWKMCLREMMMWWNIKHPNILGLLGIVTSPSAIASLDLPSTCANSMALILPYKRKLDVVEHMSHLEQEDLMVKVPRWMIQIAKALEYLHQEKIIHGDLRGKNVLVDDGDDDNVVLTDFGLSCFKDGMKGAMGTLCIGHNLYSAPEQLDPHSKNRRPTTATDVYSYARLCVELYTGAIPFNPVKDIFGEAHPSDAAVFHYLDNVCGAPPHPVFQYTGIHMDMKLWDVLTSCWIASHPPCRVD